MAVSNLSFLSKSLRKCIGMGLLLLSVNSSLLAASIGQDSVPPLSTVQIIELLAQRPDSLSERPNLIHPSIQARCTYAYNFTDDYTGRQTVGLKPSLFFSYTPDRYKRFLKDQEFITCYAHISHSTGAYYALNVELKVASPAAAENLGNIPQNSFLTLVSIEGKESTLQSFKGAKATVGKTSTSYSCSFVIDKKTLKVLKTAEISQVSIDFEKKKQLFDIYDLDIIRRQLQCFSK